MDIKKLENTKIKNFTIESYEVKVENDLIETFEKALNSSRLAFSDFK